MQFVMWRQSFGIFVAEHLFSSDRGKWRNPLHLAWCRLAFDSSQLPRSRSTQCSLASESSESPQCRWHSFHCALSLFFLCISEGGEGRGNWGPEDRLNTKDSIAEKLPKGAHMPRLFVNWRKVTTYYCCISHLRVQYIFRIFFKSRISASG